MAITNHPCFEQPPNGTLLLWRYMDLSKFIYLLATGKLFFCRSDLFDDPFEGSYSRLNASLRPLIYKDIPEENRNQIFAEFSDFLKWSREWTYLNCWHCNDHESAAMWNLYAHSGEAVAIQTDYETLSKVLPDNVYLGLVRYIDYNSEWMPEGNLFYPFLHKRKSFEHEREARALVQELPKDDERFKTRARNDVSGLNLAVEVKVLLKNVYVCPTAGQWFEDVVRLTAERFGLSIKVIKSDLFSKPVF